MNSLWFSKSVKVLFLLLLHILLNTQAFSQYFIKSNQDSTAFSRDSVILYIGYHSGIKEWQSSNDQIHWNSLPIGEDSIWIRIDSAAYYRLKLSVGDCDPVYSDHALVSFRAVPVNGTTALIEPIGGVYQFESGAILYVPPDAVETPVAVKIELFDSLGAISKLPFAADFGKSYGIGMSFETDQEEFVKPVRVRLPVPNYKVVDMPVVFQYNKKADLWSRYPGDLICSESKSFVEYTTTFPYSSRIHLIPGVFNSFTANTSGRTSEEEIDCKALIAKVKASAHDFQGKYKGDECYLTMETRDVNFPLCSDSINWKDLIMEIGKDCRVDLTHHVKNCLKNGETTTMTISASIAGIPLKDQHITVSFDPYLSSPGTTFPLVTNSEGKVSFPVKCSKDNFSGSLSYRLHYEYYLSVQEVSEGSRTEIIHRDLITGSLEGSATFRLCPYPYALQINAHCTLGLYPGETCTPDAWCVDQYGDRIDCPGIQFVILPSYTGLGSISYDEQSGLITANKGGVGKIKAFTPTLESQELDIPVFFQGSLLIEDYKDYANDWYDIMCGCPKDKVNDPEFRYYQVSYIGSMHISLLPSAYKTAPPTIIMTGNSITTYTIESPICNDATFQDSFRSLEANAIAPTLWRAATSEEVLSGDVFQILITYKNFRLEPVVIKFNTVYINHQNLFELSQSGDFIPESCIGRVNNLFLQLY